MDHDQILNPLNCTNLAPDEPGQPWTTVFDPVPGHVLSHFTVQRPGSSSSVESPYRARAVTLPSSLSPQSFSSSRTAMDLHLSPSPLSGSLQADPSSSPTVTTPTTPRMHRKGSSSVSSSTIRCEFSEGPCATGGENLRKVISHIFGRNKSCTKLCPDHVWVHYCRKHYQRARYRASLWPFTQCDLLMDSLGRMQSWGGIESFELVLRKRETKRTQGTNDAAAAAAATTAADDQDAFAAGAQTPELMSPTSAVGSPASFHSTPASAAASQSGTTTNSRRNSTGKKSPTIPPSPVPDWLRQEVGPNKSFDEIRDIIERLRVWMAAEQNAGHKISFPDIEILPKFRPGWKVAQQEMAMDEDENGEAEEEEEGGDFGVPQGSAGGHLSRVNRKGAVRKIPVTTTAGPTTTTTSSRK